MTETDVAYVAGLFDGEGHVSICRNAKCTNSYVVLVGITNQSRTTLEWIQSMFGGGVYRNSKPPAQTAVYQWIIKTNAVGEFLAAVFPYLRIKRRQAELGLEFRRTAILNPSRRRVPPEIVARREALRVELQSLNACCGNKKHKT